MTSNVKVTPPKGKTLEMEGTELPLLDLSEAAVKELIRSAKKRGRGASSMVDVPGPHINGRVPTKKSCRPGNRQMPSAVSGQIRSSQAIRPVSIPFLAIRSWEC